MTMSRVAIVEDHLLLAETLHAALTYRGIEAVVLPLDDLDTLLATLLDCAADLVLLDLDLGSLGDTTCIIAPLTVAGIRVLVVTGAVDRMRIAGAVEQGALGCQPKALGFDALLASTCAALAGTPVLAQADRAALMRELARARADELRRTAIYARLTGREQGTLQALGEGQSVVEIAGDWVVSEATVRSHVRGVLVKLGVVSQLAAVAEARRNGWLTPLARRPPLYRG